MIKNGKDLNINSSALGLPNMTCSVTGFFQRMTFGLVSTEQVDGFTQTIIHTIVSRGVKQPFTSEQLQTKPEGERSWNWFTLHCLPDIQLNTDDRIVLSHVKYRVMEKLNYAEYGYLEYHIVEDYTNE